MRLPPPNPRISALAVMGVLVLMVAVFGWGLQYKLSLYNHSGGHPRSISQAKLLSQKERSAPSVSLDRSGPDAFEQRVLVSGPTFLVAAILLSSLAAVYLWFRVDAVLGYSSQQRLAASNFFAFRPPPASLFSN